MKIVIFTAVKNRCILHGRVFVMVAIMQTFTHRCFVYFQMKKLTTYTNLNSPYPTQLPATPRDPPRTEPAPMIYVCATMWHETQKEMLQMLTSIFRLVSKHTERISALHKVNQLCLNAIKSFIHTGSNSLSVMNKCINHISGMVASLTEGHCIIHRICFFTN